MNKTSILSGTCGAYAAPECEVLAFHVESRLLETSFTGSTIDDATIEDWGTI